MLTDCGMRHAARRLRDVSAARCAELERREMEQFAVTHDAITRRMNDKSRARSATRPQIIETSAERQLQFKDSVLQSRMRLDDPFALVAPYTRQMMSFLLFNPDPAHVLMIGLGGGSMPKFCFKNLPAAKITVVELDTRVIAMRESFHVPPDDERFRVVHDDGARYLSHRGSAVDAILIDAFDEEGVAPSLAASDFFSNAQRRLTDDGVLIMNLLGKPETYAAHIARASDAFDNRVLLAPVPGNDNMLMFAFKPEVISPSSPQLMLRARHLQSRYQLHFRRYLQQLRDAQRSLAG
jgi:spermidine synthase